MSTRAPKGFCGRCGGTREPYKDCAPCRRERERERYATDEAYRADKIRRATANYAADPEPHKARERVRQATPEYRAKERERGNARYAAWRLKWLERLGGVCVECGATDDLHFDHIDWREKRFNVAIRWRIKDELMAEEMLRCQLLCVTHHRLKTVGDMRSMRKLGFPLSKTSSVSNSSPGSETSSTT